MYNTPRGKLGGLHEAHQACTASYSQRQAAHDRTFSSSSGTRYARVLEETHLFLQFTEQCPCAARKNRRWSSVPASMHTKRKESHAQSLTRQVQRARDHEYDELYQALVVTLSADGDVPCCVCSQRMFCQVSNRRWRRVNGLPSLALVKRSRQTLPMTLFRRTGDVVAAVI